MKRLIAFLMSASMLCCLMLPASASNQIPKETPSSEIGLSRTYEESLRTLLDAGYTQKDAEKLLEFDRILKKMETFQQTIDLIDGEWIITSSPLDGVDHITLSEKELLIEMFTPYTSSTYTHSSSMTLEEAYAELNQAIKEDPLAPHHVIDMGNGSKLQSTLNVINDTTVPTARDGGVTTEDQYVFFSYGTKTLSYTLRLTGAGYYAQVVVNATANCTENGMSLTHVSGKQASSGMISIQNSGVSLNDSPATSIGDWCEARNDVVFAYTGSVGITLKGVLSINLNVGVNWTQSAILRAWNTDPYGHVLELAEVYTVLS